MDVLDGTDEVGPSEDEIRRVRLLDRDRSSPDGLEGPRPRWAWEGQDRALIDKSICYIKADE